jgi:hypothetical protein
MVGILGAAVAGGAAGYANQRIDTLGKQEDFNMKMALMDAESDRQLRLKEQGIELEEKAAGRERERVGGLLKSAEDPNADKGGYETPEMKVKAKRDTLERQIKVLKENGDLDAAKGIQSELTALDNSDLKLQQLDAKLTQIANSYAVGQERLKLEGEKVKLQGEVSAAKITAASAKADAEAVRRNKPTVDETRITQFLKAYGDDPTYVKSDGTPTPKGFDKIYGKEAMVTETSGTVTDEYGETKTINNKKTTRPANDIKTFTYDRKSRSLLE